MEPALCLLSDRVQLEVDGFRVRYFYITSTRTWGKWLMRGWNSWCNYETWECVCSVGETFSTIRWPLGGNWQPHGGQPEGIHGKRCCTKPWPRVLFVWQSLWNCLECGHFRLRVTVRGTGQPRPESQVPSGTWARGLPTVLVPNVSILLRPGTQQDHPSPFSSS